MGLSQLVEVLSATNFPYTRDDETGTIMFPIEGAYGVYRIRFSEDGDVVQGGVWFSAKASFDPTLFCENLSKRSEGVQIGTDPSDGQFYAGMFLMPDAVLKSIRFFVDICDMVLPLLLHVDQYQQWNQQLIDLAFTPLGTRN